MTYFPPGEWFGLGAVPVKLPSPSEQCWADRLVLESQSVNPPCNEQITHDIGLCDRHYAEVVG